MYSKIIFIVMTTFLAFTAAGQEEAPEKNLYNASAFVELTTWRGSVAGTLNFELFVSKKPGGLSLRAGIGGTSLDKETVLTIPANISYSISLEESRKHYLELGTGFTAYVFTAPEGWGSIWGTWPIPIWNGVVGYRFMSNRLHVRVSYMPRLIALDTEDRGLNGMFGVSCGIRF